VSGLELDTLVSSVLALCVHCPPHIFDLATPLGKSVVFAVERKDSLPLPNSFFGTNQF